MSTITDLNFDVHLHAEIELLKQALVDKQNQLIAMETACLRESDRQVELEDSIIAWQDKYDRLYESHKRVQKVNQNLEDKLLKLVDRNSNERAQLTSDVATLSVRLAQANYNIATLQREIERYKTDMGLAIQLLQCKPDSFVSQKITSLPLEMKSKITQYMRLDTQSQSDSEDSIANVATSGLYRVLPASDSPPPMCPFPPTAMVYSMRGLDDDPASTETPIVAATSIIPSGPTSSDMISPAIIAKYLEEELKASEIKHCDTCLCASGHRDLTVLADTARSYSIGTQTHLHGDANNSLCLRCNNNLNSPSRTNSPYIMKLVKSSDSVISETKSSYSGSLTGLNAQDKLYSPLKKDDLTVNPILGHHRLCERTTSQMQREAVSVELQIENEIRGLSNKAMHLSNGKHSMATANSGATMRLQKDRIGNGGDCATTKNVTIDTASGSTNSLWSKSSSNNNTNADGTKMFETFNRNLIKSIKADNPAVAGPRLCALRIQNGTSNILLDNIESDVSPVIYTRRSRLLDEELDETKDIITSPCSSSHLSEKPLPFATMNANKTDYEKCREVNPTVGVTILRKDLLSGSSMSISTATNDRSPQLAPVVLANVKHRLDPNKGATVDNTTNSSNRTVNQSATQSSLVSTNEPNIQESAILRRQQLNRVAEWVQNNHLDGVLMEGGRKSDGESVASLDSGYKTKVNNNLSQCDEDVDESPKTKATPALSSLSDDKKLNPNRVSNDLAQNLSNINNNVDIGRRLSTMGNNATNATIDICDEPIADATPQVDFAQMEYNVKQFLLKQNEWSINGQQQKNKDSNVTPQINPHRTETNL